jgi:hypothetical protein
MDYILSEK